MAQIVVLMAGLLFIAESQAGDLVDRSTHKGFLSKYVPSEFDVSKSSMSDYDNFITPNLNHVKHGNGPDALSYHNNPVEHGPFMTVDDKPMLHPTQLQDSMTFTPARGETSISNKDINPAKIAIREDKQTAQKLLANSINYSISLSAIGIGLLSLMTMLVVHLRTGLQPATILASSGGLGPDMPMNTKSALGDNVMEMKSQDSNVKVNSGGVGWGQLSSQSARPQTFCYVSKREMAALAEANPNFLGKSIGLWDPLGCLDRDLCDLDNEATIGCLRQAEIKHGRISLLLAPAKLARRGLLAAAPAMALGVAQTASAATAFEKDFKLADTNRDGKLTQAEFATWYEGNDLLTKKDLFSLDLSLPEIAFDLTGLVGIVVAIYGVSYAYYLQQKMDAADAKTAKKAAADKKKAAADKKAAAAEKKAAAEAKKAAAEAAKAKTDES